jgi:hypothetical protein
MIIDAGNRKVQFGIGAGGGFTENASLQDVTSGALGGSTAGDATTEDGFRITAGTGKVLTLASGKDFINAEGRIYQYLANDSFSYGTSPNAKGNLQVNSPLYAVSSQFGGTRGLSITTHELSAPLDWIKPQDDSGETPSGSNMTAYFDDDQINASLFGYNSRGAGTGLLCGGYFAVNDAFVSAAIVADGSVRNSDMQASSWSLVARRRPMVVGNPWALGVKSKFTDGRIYGRHVTGTSDDRWAEWNNYPYGNEDGHMPADQLCTLIAFPFDAGSEDPGGSDIGTANKAPDHGGEMAFGYSDGTVGASATKADQFRGRVAIGRWEPEYKLDVNGTIRASGDVIAYSDRRHKTNIETIKNPIAIVKGMRGVYFNWKDKYAKWAGMPYGDAKRRKTGVIAQEVEKVLPEIVFEGSGPDDKGFKNVDYGKMTGVLIEAIKEQQVQIEELQKEVTKLKENK